ncbi:hypothetical protein FNV43_RR15044 [Rhamnella rubrinervis]|uniref:Uncharacterized protein n=1 Tax=Rhamnella rubrinervis TaxID=2594499 RepID=A0A8K0GX56_9ROSA|nr:hypothetical protein FNV43_RR15044 [Rhamnella rubrinervis]
MLSPSGMAGINQEMSITAQPTSPDLDAALSRTDFDFEVGKSVQTTSNHTMVPRQITSWVDAFGDSDEELSDANDIVKDKWQPLQGEGFSKPSNEFDGTFYMGQQLNTMIMVPFDSWIALTATQRNLNLIASQPTGCCRVVQSWDCQISRTLVGLDLGFETFASGLTSWICLVGADVYAGRLRSRSLMRASAWTSADHWALARFELGFLL